MKESETRSRILDVASRLFYEQGYNLTGINQIIEEANIAKASLYNHFPSKKDLLQAYLEEAEEMGATKLKAYLHNIKEPRKKLLALFDHRIEAQYNSSFGGCPFIKISAETDKKDEIVFKKVAAQKERVKQLITELLGNVDVNKEQPLKKEMLADTLFLLLEGATVSATIQKNVQPLKQARKIAETLL